MAQNDLLRRYLDAGIQFTQMTQKRAEAIVKDLVRAGEVQTEQAQAMAADIIDRSRKNSERMVEQVRREVKAQIANLGLATQDDIARLERKISAVGSRPAAKKAAPAKRAPAKKAAAKKATGRRTATAKKAG